RLDTLCGTLWGNVFAQQFPIVDNNGKVYDYLIVAQKCGVIFDLGHGAGSFWFRNAAPAIEQGFFPDTISTDLHVLNVNGPAENPGGRLRLSNEPQVVVCRGDLYELADLAVRDSATSTGRGLVASLLGRFWRVTSDVRKELR